MLVRRAVSWLAAAMGAVVTATTEQESGGECGEFEWNGNGAELAGD